MENKNYYDILGVSVKATLDEITAAKNLLAKRYHPDVNMKLGVDTTEQMQEILEAYRILSDPKKRSEYDREITGRTAVMQTFDLRNEEEPEEDCAPTFVTYWKAASAVRYYCRKRRPFQGEGPLQPARPAVHAGYQIRHLAARRQHSGKILAS